MFRKQRNSLVRKNGRGAGLRIARFRDLLVNRYYLLANRLLGFILLFFAFVLLKDALHFFSFLG